MLAVTSYTHRGNSILDALPEIERREIFAVSKTLTVAADDSVYDFGDAVNYLYFPLTSVFSTTSLMEDGSSAEISLTGNEGAVGVFAAFQDQPSRYWTNVLIGGEVIKIEIAALRQILIESEILKTALLNSYRNLTAQISQRAVCNGRHSLAERLSFWLLLVHDRVKTADILLTHETIAKKLGARRAGITKIAGSLQTAETIAYSRGTIKILQRSALEKESCECYQAIRNAF